MMQENNTIPKELTFPETENLTQMQTHLRKLCDHFGWETAAEKKFLLLVEEVGELAKAIRNQERIFLSQPVGNQNKPQNADLRKNLADEFADVLSYLMDLANQYDIDLGHAYTEKMTANFSRQWE